MMKVKMLWLTSMIISLASGAFSVANAQPCKTCNCQFNNAQVLSEIVKTQVNRILAKEPSKLFM